MNQTVASTATASLTTGSSQGPRALRILAKSVFRELRSSGYSRSDMVAFATEMLALVSSDLREGDRESIPSDIAAE